MDTEGYQKVLQFCEESTNIQTKNVLKQSRKIKFRTVF